MSSLRPMLSRLPGRRIATPLYLLLAIALVVWAVRYHEPWRDEAQAALIGRDVPLWKMWDVLRYEIHPPLIFVLMKLSTALLPPPWSLFAVGGFGYYVLLEGTHSLLARFSKRTFVVTAVTLALGCTDIYAYELSVVVRSYGLALGLLFLASARLHAAVSGEDEVKNARAGAIYACLAGLTEIVGTIVTTSLVAAFVVICLLRKKGPLAKLPALLSLPPVAIVYAITRPWELRVTQYEPEKFDGKWKPLWDRGVDQVVKSLDYRHWWPVELDALHHTSLLKALTLGVCLAALLRLGRAWKEPLRELFLPVSFTFGAAALLYLLLFRFTHTELTHTVFLAMPMVVLSLGWIIAEDVRFVGRFVLLGLFYPWFSNEYSIRKSNYTFDLENEFSHTKSVAAVLPPGARVFSWIDWAATSVGYLGDHVTLRSPQSAGAYYSYVEWSKQEQKTVPADPLIREECTKSPEAVFVLGNIGPRQCRSVVSKRVGGTLAATGEWDDLSKVDCACMLR